MLWEMGNYFGVVCLRIEKKTDFSVMVIGVTWPYMPY